MEKDGGDFSTHSAKLHSVEMTKNVIPSSPSRHSKFLPVIPSERREPRNFPAPITYDIISRKEIHLERDMGTGVEIK
jgi:hypothetical protein